MASGPVNVLIVDDAAAIRLRLVQQLSAVPGVEVIAETGGVAEAIARTMLHEPDLVVLDLKLPDGTGFDVLSRLRVMTGRFTTRPPVIAILTNHNQPLYRARCLELGADHFFDKATEFDGITRVARALVEDRQ